jgi:L-rhamnose mutarotase
MPAFSILHTPLHRDGKLMNYAFRMKLKPGTAGEYQRRHDEIWPELAALLHEAGIYDYSIFLDEETLHLFAVLKLRPENTRDTLAAHPLMRRWWNYMRDLMQTHEDGRPIEWPLVPVFHLD